MKHLIPALNSIVEGIYNDEPREWLVAKLDGIIYGLETLGVNPALPDARAVAVVEEEVAL